MPPPCVGPTSYGSAAFSPVAVGWNRFFPPFTVTPAASVHPSFACGLLLSASVILFFGCFRCLSTAVLSFVFSYLYVFFVRSCSFVNRVWAGHLADELLVRALERCDWFARLLRPPPLCKYKQIYNINQIFDHISYLYSRSQEGLFPCDRLVISLAYGLYGAGIDLIMLFFCR